MDPQMVIDRSGRGYLLGHDDGGYRVWAAGGETSAGRTFPNTPEGWQQAWREFEWLESQLPAAPPPPVRTGPSRARRLIPIGAIVAAVGVLGVGIWVVTERGGGLVFRDDFSTPFTISEGVGTTEFVDGTLHVGTDETVEVADVGIYTCVGSPGRLPCGLGSTAVRVITDVHVVKAQAGTRAGVGIGCFNRNSSLGYVFMAWGGASPQFEILAVEGSLAMVDASPGFVLDQTRQLSARCVGGVDGAGTTLIFEVDGETVLRTNDPGRDDTFFDILDVLVAGPPGTEAAFDNVVLTAT